MPRGLRRRGRDRSSVPLACSASGGFPARAGWPCCCCQRQFKLLHHSSTGTAFPPRLLSAIEPDFRRACGTMQSSDFCRTVGDGSCVPLAYPLQGIRQISLGKFPDHERYPVANTPRDTDGTGFETMRSLTLTRCLTALHLRSEQRSTYGFHQTTPRGNEPIYARILAARERPVALVLQRTPLPHRWRVPPSRASG